MSSHELMDREIASAFQRGWTLNNQGCEATHGMSSLANVIRAGWDSYQRGEGCEEGLKRFLKETETAPAETPQRECWKQLLQLTNQCSKARAFCRTWTDATCAHLAEQAQIFREDLLRAQSEADDEPTQETQQ